MGNLGATELILIFLVVLLVFGAKRIPEIARGLGKGIREFKDATTDIKKELTVDPNHQLPRPQPPAYGQPVGQQPFAQAAPPPAAPPVVQTYADPQASPTAPPQGPAQP